MTALIMTADERQKIIEQGKEQNEVTSRPMTTAEKIKYGIPVDTETRTCKRCGEIKPLADFTKHNKDKSGYSHVCKACATGGRAKIQAPVEIKFSDEIETLRAENAELRQMLEGAKSTVMELREGMKNRSPEILQRAISQFGKESQMHKCIEECAELIQAILQNFCEKEWFCDNVREEIADVQIMIDQMRLIFGDTTAEETYKLARLAARLEAMKG